MIPAVSRHPSPARQGLAGLFGLILLLIPSLGFAASIKAQLNREVVGLGDSAMLEVTLDGVDGTPTVPGVPGLDIRQVSKQSQITIVNGRPSSTLTLGFSVTPSRLGEFAVGPVTVRSTGGVLTAPAVKLRVVPPNDPAARRADALDGAAFLELHVPAREIYVGERIVAEAHLYALGGNLTRTPVFEANGFTLGRLTNAPTERNIRTNNHIYARIRLLQPLTAARTGELPVSATGGLLEIAVSSGRDLLEDFFGSRTVRRFNLATDPATLRVLPLPREGQPPEFNGAVGDFTAQLTASPTEVAAGDPVTARITLRGRGNFDSVLLPDQPAWRGFRAYPPQVQTEFTDPVEMNGAKTFEQVLIPESADLKEIPGFTFAFFDPAQKAYRMVRTPPVPLRVSAGAATPSLPANAAQGAPATAATSSKPTQIPLRPHLGPLVAEMPGQIWLRQPAFPVVYVLPILTWLGVRGWRRHRASRDADSVARQRAALRKRVAEGLRQLVQLQSAGDLDGFHATLFRVLQDAIAARTGLASASITEGTLDAAFPPGSIPDETRASLHGLFQACNQARYAKGATAGDLAALREEADGVTRKLAETAPPSR